MTYSIDQTSIALLQKRFLGDSSTEDLSFLHESLLAFSKYAAAIYQLEVYMILNGKDADPDERESLDKVRTHAHESVIRHIEPLNGFCKKYGIPPVYAGTVSEARPFRVEIADAVLSYVNDVLEKRVR